MSTSVFSNNYSKLIGLAITLVVVVVSTLLLLGGPINSLLANPDLLFPGFDKILHALANAFLACLIYFGLRNFIGIKNNLKLSTFSIAIVVCFSVLHETYQAFSPSRSFEMEDILANLSGAILSITLILHKKLNHPILVVLIGAPIAVILLLTLLTYQKQHNYYEGLEYARSKNYTLAKNAYLKSIILGNKKPSVYNSLAWLNMEHLHKDIEESLQLSAYAVDRKPNNANFLDTHGWALVLNGQPEKGLKYLKQAFSINPDIFCINYHIGVAYFDLNNFTDAIYYLKQQIEYNREDSYAKRSSDYLEKIKKLNTASPAEIIQ